MSLLRAVNLGAHNKVPMPALREHLAEVGFDDVRTYVQSGNIVTRSAHRSAAEVGKLVAAVVKDNFGVDTIVVVRSPKQLSAILDWNPFPDATEREPKWVQVVHLTGTPDQAAVSRLLTADVGDEAIAAKGKEIVVDYADGIQASKADRAIKQAKLGVEGTARNWRTLTALVEMTAD